MELRFSLMHILHLALPGSRLKAIIPIQTCCIQIYFVRIKLCAAVSWYMHGVCIQASEL